MKMTKVVHGALKKMMKKKGIRSSLKEMNRSKLNRLWKSIKSRVET